MRIITTKAHAFIDYTTGLTMIAFPWIPGLISHPLAAYILIVSGALMIIHSLITDYEGGIFCQVMMPHHLKIDILSGLLLAISPFFVDTGLTAPYIIIFGLLRVCIALVSQTIPSYKGYHGSAYKKFEKFPSMKY